MQNKNINNVQTAVFARSGLLKSKDGSMGSAENKDLRPLVKCQMIFATKFITINLHTL